MGDAAQGELLRHEVFEKPYKVKPQFEKVATPDNYRRFPGGKDLPSTQTIWRVQNSGKRYGGVVSRLFGYEDSPDAEILTAGFNDGKESGAVGVGRHGNFLQWGFSAPPSQMTEAGKRFFLNCICYIHQFDGIKPLVYRQSSHRINSIRLAALINVIDDKNFFSGTFPEELQKQYKGNPDGLVKYYRTDFELIYRDRVFQVDQELKALGVSSNREIQTLARLITLLEDGQSPNQVRPLLVRYTTENFQTAAEWRAWFEINRDRFYFSDVGGYKFRIIPEGYPVPKRKSG